ncbi:MAG: hypothetical protein LUD41_03570 [Phascolarctobacterium sp.]|nr:hypothetical protein [Phascolarctobacterium sp.]
MEEERKADFSGDEAADEKLNREKIRQNVEEELERQFAEGFPDDEEERGPKEDWALEEIGVEWEAEKICRWGAPRGRAS